MPGVNISLPAVAYTGHDPFAFISYAHRDAEIVYPEIQRLDLMGYRVWYDEGIDPGNEWPEEVAGALKRSEQFIVFVTPRAVASANVRNEINYALKLAKPFFAIHLGETELPPGMDLQMSSIQAILKWRMDEQTYVRNLERALPRSLGDSAAGSAPGSGASGGLADLIARTAFSDMQAHSNGEHANWHQLDPGEQRIWLDQSRRILRMLHIAGFNVSRAEGSDSGVTLPDDVVDFMARMEHDAWARERTDAGWRYGPLRSYGDKVTPNLIPWEQTLEHTRQIDRDAILRLPELLLRSGYYISSLYEQPDRQTLFNPASE
jgi:hypothetical protein